MRKAFIALAVLLLAFVATFLFGRSRTLQLFGEIVPRVDTDRKIVALTFDDGPMPETVDEILAMLAQEKIRATFFVCGAQIEEHPEVAKKLVAAGHELGNHTYSHERMWLKSTAYITSEIERTDALIRDAGYRGPIYFRAPYCKKLVALPRYLAAHDRIHITWDVEPESDPEIDADTNKIVADVLEKARPGSIILLHPWYRSRNRTRAAVPAVLAGLKQRGYSFVTVEELLAERRRSGQ